MLEALGQIPDITSHLSPPAALGEGTHEADGSRPPTSNGPPSSKLLSARHVIVQQSVCRSPKEPDELQLPSTQHSHTAVPLLTDIDRRVLTTGDGQPERQPNQSGLQPTATGTNNSSEYVSRVTIVH